MYPPQTTQNEMGDIKHTAGTIIKSHLDKRLYRGVVLSNGIKVILISDKETDTSAAALDVCVGNMHDPPELPGLAHLCEHVVLVGAGRGSLQSDFMSQYGAKYNGSTYTDHTSYYFDILPEHLSKGLHKLSQCVKSPVFTEAAINCEVMAINNEHEVNILKDRMRLCNLVKLTCKQNHPFHQFDTGSRRTLYSIPKRDNIDVCSALEKFHKAWYSSNIMSLCVLGRESLDDLQNMVIKSFGEIRNTHAVLSLWLEHPCGVQELGLKCYMVPIIPTQYLEIHFPISDFSVYYKSDPGLYLSSIFEIDSPGSLKHLLRKKQLCTNLSAVAKTIARGFGFFIIRIDLTEEGLHDIDTVVKMVCQYINMLKAKSPMAWVFDKLRTVKAENFTYEEEAFPVRYAEDISVNLHHYPMEETLSGFYCLEDWRPDLIEMLLNNLKVQNIRLFITSQEFQRKADQEDPWYGTKYRLEKIPDDVMNDWQQSSVNEDLKIPEQVDTSNIHLHLLPREKYKFQHPVVVKDTPLLRVWYKQDIYQSLPKADLVLEFILNQANKGPSSSNMCSMFVELFLCQLRELEQCPDMKEFDYTLQDTKSGMILVLKGFNDELPPMLDKMLEVLKQFKLKVPAFEVLKERRVKMWKNLEKIDPYMLAQYYLECILAEKEWSYHDAERATKQLRFKEFKSFVQEMLSKMYVECFLHGHVNREMATDLADLVEKKVGSIVGALPVLPHQLLRNREYELPEGSSHVLEVQITTHPNSALGLYYQCPQQTTRNNVLLQLLVQILEQPFLTTLRMKEQLGYYVHCASLTYLESQGLMILIQTDKCPRFVDARVETFLASMEDYIRNMTEKEFENHKEAVAGQKLAKCNSLYDSTKRYWREIHSRQYHFDRHKHEIADLQQVKKKHVMNFYKSWISRNSPRRRKLAVLIISSEADIGFMSQTAISPVSVRCMTPKRIENIKSFQKSLMFFPRTEPFTKITTLSKRKQCSTVKGSDRKRGRNM